MQPDGHGEVPGAGTEAQVSRVITRLRVGGHFHGNPKGLVLSGVQGFGLLVQGKGIGPPPGEGARVGRLPYPYPPVCRWLGSTLGTSRETAIINKNSTFFIAAQLIHDYIISNSRSIIFFFPSFSTSILTTSPIISSSTISTKPPSGRISTSIPFTLTLAPSSTTP